QESAINPFCGEPTATAFATVASGSPLNHSCPDPRPCEDATMLRYSSWPVGCLTLFLLACPGFGQGGEAVLKFGPPDFKWKNSHGGTTGQTWIFQQGDSWSQAFKGTGLPTTDHLTLSLHIEDGLSGGAKVEVDVRVNG